MTQMLSENVKLRSLQAQPENAIEVREVSKTYAAKKVVNGVSFAVKRGEIFGILGPNGAGKSTTLEMIEGLREPDKNANTTLFVDGLDVRNKKQRDELHQRIGLQLQTSSLFDEMTVGENLKMLAMLYRQARPVNEILQEFKLIEKATARLGTLSGGQKQRMALAAALINDPTIIFLDEPTTALDPQARRDVWDIIRKLQNSGKTIVLTTHYMEEAEKLCERVAIMNNGSIVALNTPPQLIQQYAPEHVITCRVNGAKTDLTGLAAVSKVNYSAEGTATIYTNNLAITLAALIELSKQAGFSLEELSTRSSSLEDVFLNLTGNSLKAE
jgi:ABC-2 type transport system ATP-binding protein